MMQWLLAVHDVQEVVANTKVALVAALLVDLHDAF
jgi:hypothetical protein